MEILDVEKLIKYGKKIVRESIGLQQRIESTLHKFLLDIGCEWKEKEDKYVVTSEQKEQFEVIIESLKAELVKYVNELRDNYISDMRIL
jgi:hypothetical protein